MLLLLVVVVVLVVVDNVVVVVDVVVVVVLLVVDIAITLIVFVSVRLPSPSLELKRVANVFIV